MAEENAYMIPTSKKEVEALGWEISRNWALRVCISG